MKVSIEKLPKSQVELDFEIPVEELEKFIEKASAELSQNVEVQGFRKGKAPKEIVEKEVGQERILALAADKAIEDSYFKAVSEHNLEVIAPPQINILKLAKGNPLQFKATVFVLPEFDLPDYQKIVSQIEKKPIKVTEEEIERMRKEKERWEKEKLRGEILEKIAEKSSIEIPQVLLEQEQKRMLETLKNNVVQTLQISFEDYLKKLNKTEKEMLESLTKEAEQRIKASLVLRAIGKKENISVEDKEIEQEMGKSPFQKEHKQEIDQEQIKSYTKEALINEKTFQILEKLLKQ